MRRGFVKKKKKKKKKKGTAKERWQDEDEIRSIQLIFDSIQE
jgi:hypothetical protein